jgi:D-3-phosphoglycerate dehydrogenase
VNDTVLLTDHPWPDVLIEQSILHAAGFKLIAGPIEAQPAEIIEASVVRHAPSAIMCCWAQVSERAVQSAPKLKIVSRMGVGLDNIAVAAATAQGAWVTNVPDYCVEEVSDHAIAMILAHWRGINDFDREAKLGRWNSASANLKRIRTMKVGIVGFGRIGQMTARKLSQGFSTQVMANSPSLLRQHAEGTEIAPQIKVASIAAIQAQADAIVLHMPLTADNRKMVNASFVAGLKRKPLIVNVSRGGLIDNAALLSGLDSGQVSGAALDVIEGEPTPPKEIMSRPDIIVTPHVAFSSDASLEELRRRCAEEVVRVLRGERPHHPCNAPSV